MGHAGQRAEPHTYDGPVASDAEIGFPGGNPDERELLLSWLDYLRGAVLRKIEGVADQDARCRPQGRLIPLLGVARQSPTLL